MQRPILCQVPLWNRRDALKLLAGTTACTLLGCDGPPPRSAEHRMLLELNCDYLGHKASQSEAIELAQRFNFDAVAPHAEELARLKPNGLAAIKESARLAGLVFGVAVLRVRFEASPLTFDLQLRSLPAEAAALQAVGATRACTWLMPYDNELDYAANVQRHVERIRHAASILDDYGLRLGLEYLGPRTEWTKGKHAFVHSLADTLKLLHAVNRPNVGIVLDSWHWYTAQETTADLAQLSADHIVAVDLNDAPVGIPVDEQVDLRRELPATTWVIDIAAFLGALRQIGYAGPVRAEPFNADLQQLPRAAAVQQTAAALQRALAHAR